MSSFDRSAHRLAGSGNVAGGLIIKKKQDSSREKSDDDFKRPSGSLLGLDVLARRKRAEREAEENSVVHGEKRPRIERRKERELADSYDDSGVRLSFGRSDAARERKYRSGILETPSHPGGVSEEALEKMHNRMKRDQGQGLYATTSSGGRGRERGERDRRDEMSEGGGGRGRREEGRGRQRRDGEREDSRRMRERAWEQETPKLERGRGNTTPYPRTRGTCTCVTVVYVYTYMYMYMCKYSTCVEHVK